VFRITDLQRRALNPNYWKFIAPLIIVLSPICAALAQESEPKVFGWVEEGLIQPENIPVKIKMDTGALTSSMDAKDLELVKINGENWVRFQVEVKDNDTGALVSAPFLRRIERNIRVRGAGGIEHRPVVVMQICIGNQVYEEQFSLKDRSKMSYPVLIGRRTLENLGLVDVTRTFTMKPDCDNSEPPQ
jgi:hypothetical protein